ncbi:MAG: pyruvate carboxylase [Sphingobium sp.]
MTKRIRRLMVANRSEIAIRVFRAAAEMDIATIAIYAEEDRLSLHRFKSDEAYRVGAGKGPLQAYLDIDDIIATAVRAHVDAIHPGYGFLSESPEFAEACAAAGIIFIGPSPDTMRQLGNKVAARNLAVRAGVPVMPATDPLPDDDAEVKRLAAGIGYPVMLKASWGGGGRGMRPIESEAGLLEAVAAARREAAAAFGKDEVYLEKLVRRARHVEVQLLGDTSGNLVHLFERDCTIQRRHQKVVERAPAPYLGDAQRAELAEAALKIGRATGYVGAGTVEFLMDADTGKFYFIEVNPRIQVEHTVTEVVTGLDIVKAQIRIAEGGRIGEVKETGIPEQEAIGLDGHAMQCRVTTEDPERGFAPDYGRITAYRGASGFGIRVDGGTAYSGAVVTPFYDAMLEKVTAWASTPEETIARMDRALREYRIRGVATNLPFLEAVLAHPDFQAMNYTTRFIDDTPELFNLPRRRDRATKLLTSIAEVTINGHPEMKNRTPVPTDRRVGEAPAFGRFLGNAVPSGGKQRFDALGAEGFARWMREQPQVLITDTTMRDAHQSLLATRMRSFDLVPAARSYATGLPDLLSLECWGGATFDVAMRFLTEDPWERLAAIRAGAPNLLLQMLLRGANGVGYTNYPDNVVRFFIAQAAEAGIDLFRVFDCLNWVENMRVAIDAVREAGRIAEGAICYTGDVLDPARPKYSLSYYADLARQLEAAGCQVLAIKDMAGLLRPAGVRALIGALRDVTDLSIHLHTHDTSGLAGATLIAAVEAGVDAIDVATDAMSGTTSQPCLGSVVEALRHTPRDTGLDAGAIRRISFYWEGVRALYAPFESDLRSGASEVYLHEMPGGQFTNLKEQARALGLENRWHEVARAYREANDLFGDIVKVTPSSKVVGDMALMMVAQGLTPDDVLDPERDIAFPASVVEMLKGDLGQPAGGWPEAVQKKALRGEAPITERPAAFLGEADLEAARAEAGTVVGRTVGDRDLASWLMYPKVFADFARASAAGGPVSALPTPVFFGGMKPGEEIVVEIEPGKSLIIRLQAIGEPEPEGHVKLFFELNGQPRVIRIADSSRAVMTARRKADEGNDRHIAAPMAGAVSSIAVRKGQKVAAGEPLLTVEAMKMETTLSAPCAGVVADICVEARTNIEAKDLLVILE